MLFPKKAQSKTKWYIGQTMQINLKQYIVSCIIHISHRKYQYRFDSIVSCSNKMSNVVMFILYTLLMMMTSTGNLAKLWTIFQLMSSEPLKAFKILSEWKEFDAEGNSTEWSLQRISCLRHIWWNILDLSVPRHNNHPPHPNLLRSITLTQLHSSGVLIRREKMQWRVCTDRKIARGCTVYISACEQTKKPHIAGWAPIIIVLQHRFLNFHESTLYIQPWKYRL